MNCPMIQCASCILDGLLVVDTVCLSKLNFEVMKHIYDLRRQAAGMDVPESKVSMTLVHKNIWNRAVETNLGAR